VRDDAESAADGREQPPPIALETVYTTPVPGMAATISEVATNSADTPPPPSLVAATTASAETAASAIEPARRPRARRWRTWNSRLRRR
jgi:hypothetical protein